MTALQLIELAVAAAILAAGVLLYRRRPAGEGANGGERYGSQGAVLLFAVGALLAIHALGLMNYRPSQSELEVLSGNDG